MKTLMTLDVSLEPRCSVAYGITAVLLSVRVDGQSAGVYKGVALKREDEPWDIAIGYREAVKHAVEQLPDRPWPWPTSPQQAALSAAEAELARLRSGRLILRPSRCVVEVVWND